MGDDDEGSRVSAAALALPSESLQHKVTGGRNGVPRVMLGGEDYEELARAVGEREEVVEQRGAGRQKQL